MSEKLIYLMVIVYGVMLCLAGFTLYRIVLATMYSVPFDPTVNYALVFCLLGLFMTDIAMLRARVRTLECLLESVK